MKCTTLGIDKIKIKKEQENCHIYLDLIEELEAHSSAHLKPEISLENRKMMFRDYPEWQFFANDEEKNFFPYYFMMKARYILKHLRHDDFRYRKSLELKKYYGILPDEFEFVKKNLTYLHWCMNKTDLRKYKDIIKSFYIDKGMSLRKYVERHKDEGMTLKKIQKLKEEMQNTYIQCLSNNAFKIQLADTFLEQLSIKPYAQNPNDIDTMKQRIAELLINLPKYNYVQDENIDK